jgi:hypothetical protein
MTDVGGTCFHSRMARHEAPDGAASHPLVAEALSRRAAAGGGARHERTPLPGTEGPIGWPGPDPDEGGEPIGWPGGLPSSPGGEQHPAQDDEPAEPVPRDSARPRGWRRLLGRSRAA